MSTLVVSKILGGKQIEKDTYKSNFLCVRKLFFNGLNRRIFTIQIMRIS